MLKSVGLNTNDVKEEVKEKEPEVNHDLRNGLIIWAILTIIFIIVIKGN